MPRRKLNTYDDYDRALRRGFGLGQLAKYKPWYRAQDVSSRGRSSKIPGILVSRPHHYLSDLESDFHQFIEFDDSVSDIREQFPLLPLQLTIDIAKEAGIRFPNVRGTKTPSIRTIDSLATRTIDGNDYLTAYSMKYCVALRKRRTLELLEIERLCCSVFGIPWFLVTEKQCDPVIAANLDWASSPLRGFLRETIEEIATDDLVASVVGSVYEGTHALQILVDRLAVDHGLNEELMNALLRALIWRKLIAVDLSVPIQRDGQITIFSRPGLQMTKGGSFGIAG